jgi:hypothetical protein
MKRSFLVILLVLQQLSSYSQSQIDPSKLPRAPYIPRVHVNGVDQVGVIQIDSLLKYGLQVVVNEKSFKVVQFDVMYDCHSRAVFDFTERRYVGDKILPTEKGLRSLVIAGDNLDVYNVVIEKDGFNYLMKPAYYSIVK